MEVHGYFDLNPYPGFKFASISYTRESLLRCEKKGINLKVSGIQIYSNKTRRFEEVELLIRDNLIAALKLSNSDYLSSGFDLTKITNANAVIADFYFPPSDVDLFYESLDVEIREKLNPDDLFDIDFNNRTFFAFYDMEDGNYLAVDKKGKVYSLVHDARPMATAMKISFKEILDDIGSGNFDREKHLDERYRKSK